MNAAHPVTRVYLVEDSPILTKLLVGLLEAEPGRARRRPGGQRASTATARHRRAPSGRRRARPASARRQRDRRDPRASARPARCRPASCSPTTPALPYRKAALEAGAHHFFDKSTEIPLMLSLIRTLSRGAKTAEVNRFGGIDAEIRMMRATAIEAGKVLDTLAALSVGFRVAATRAGHAGARGRQGEGSVRRDRRCRAR